MGIEKKYCEQLLSEGTVNTCDDTIPTGLQVSQCELEGVAIYIYRQKSQIPHVYQNVLMTDTVWRSRINLKNPHVSFTVVELSLELGVVKQTTVK